MPRLSEMKHLGLCFSFLLSRNQNQNVRDVFEPTLSLAVGISSATLVARRLGSLPGISISHGKTQIKLFLILRRLWNSQILDGMNISSHNIPHEMITMTHISNKITYNHQNLTTQSHHKNKMGFSTNHSTSITLHFNTEISTTNTQSTPLPTVNNTSVDEELTVQRNLQP